MNIRSLFLRKASWLCVIWLATAAGLFGQAFEVTPFVGARFFGTVKLQPADGTRFEGQVADSVSYGITGGYRRPSDLDDGHDVFEFRWMRQGSYLYVKQNPFQTTPSSAPAFRPSVAINHYLVDFSREFLVSDTPMLQPFLTFGAGVSHLSTPASGATRFAFDIGGGFKVFPTRQWGVRFTVEYVPTVMSADIQTVVCTSGCIFALSGGLLNQFSITIGPAYRF